jgi:soluble lytic murein transglycosylase
LRAKVAGLSRRPASRAPSRPGHARRRTRLGIAALAAGVLVAVGVALIGPVEDALKEITLPLRHDDIIRQQAHDKGLDPSLVAAVIYRESKFRDQTSDAGAKGYMQILPETAKFIAKRTGGTRFELRDLGNPQINIAYGCWYLRYLIDRYGGNRLAAVAAYNAGHEHVDAWGGSALKMDDIRFPETKQYAQDVFDKRDDYAKHYRAELGL